MKTPMKLTLLALTALALCSGCASKPTTTSYNALPPGTTYVPVTAYVPTTTYVTPTSLQANVSPQWDEAIAAQGAAKVNNNGLIMMR